MTNEEVKKIIGTMILAYPNYKPDNMSMLIELWKEMLSEYTYQQVAMALKAYIASDTSGFAPSIGQLVGKMQMINQPEELNEMEAWNLVSKAIRNGYYGAEEEFSKLPELVQKAVGSHEQLRQWAQTDIDSVENVIQSNFMRTYRAVVERSLNVSRMPVEARKMIEAINYRPTIENRNLGQIESREGRKVIPMPEGVMEKLKKELEGAENDSRANKKY